MGKGFDTDVLIIGGGISGLSAAWFLKRSGIKVRLLEKSPRTGGAIRSERRDGFLIEYGPNSTLETTPLLRELFAGVGINGEMEYANQQAAHRFIVRDGRLHALPMSPPAFLKSKLFSFSAKLRLLKEPFIRPLSADEDESLAEFVRRRLGDEFLDYAINPFVAGVYAGSPDLLSVRSAFPKLHALEKEYGSLIKGAILGARKRKRSAETSKTSARLLSFHGGLQTLIDGLNASLEENITVNATVESIVTEHEGQTVAYRAGDRSEKLRAAVLLLTVPAHRYGELPFATDFPPAAQMSKIYYPPVAMVFFGYRQKPAGVNDNGFGFLVPEKESRRILGTIWSSTIFSGRAPQGGLALTTFVGGSRQPELTLLEDSRLQSLVEADLRDLMGIQRPPDLCVIQRWEKAIPQYRLGHHFLMEAIERFEKAHPGFFVTGNFRGGISVGDCIKQSREMSDRILNHLKKLHPSAATVA